MSIQVESYQSDRTRELAAARAMLGAGANFMAMSRPYYAAPAGPATNYTSTTIGPAL